VALLVGALIASAVGLFATVLGLDRDRVAVSGFRWSRWVVVAALAAHGIFDLTQDTFIDNAGVPVCWPKFCLTYDLTAVAYLAWLLTSGRIRAAA
jgi:hypothetical protein